MLKDDDIIAAIASGQVESAIGVIRVSGKNSLKLLQQIFTKKPPYEHRRLYYGFIKDELGHTLDEVIVGIFKSPQSYTGEDSFEVYSHGGLVVMNAILDRILSEGARLAEPGEFTKRAFLNGKIDLTQAEAVATVISAKSKRALKVAQNQLQGNFSKQLSKIRDKILYLMAENEVRIDHPEEELSQLTIDDRTAIVNEIKINLSRILRATEFGDRLFKGLTLAIVGKPNVGKSSLLNLIVGEETAIVTDIPGTTRDIVKESFNIKGIPFSVLDTAGIRHTEDIVEKIGVNRSIEAINRADIILAVFDASQALDKEDFNLIDRLKTIEKPVIAVLNKTDKPIVAKKRDIPVERIIKISCLTGNGLKELENELENIALGNFDDMQLISLNATQKQALKGALNMCNQLSKDIEKDIDPALVGVNLLSLADYLDEVIGKITNEDMLDVMFKHFCIGK